MIDPNTDSHRQQNLYLTEVLHLRIACEYMRLYRNVLATRVRWFAAIRAIASNGAIGAWAVWTSYPLVWATIIAASQVGDALKDVFPFTARHKAANGCVNSMDALFIDAHYDAESVYSGRVTEDEITELRFKLMRLQQKIEREHFPNGDLPERADLMALAEERATAYFDSMFGPRTTA